MVLEGLQENCRDARARPKTRKGMGIPGSEAAVSGPNL